MKNPNMPTKPKLFGAKVNHTAETGFPANMHGNRPRRLQKGNYSPLQNQS